MTPTLSLSCVWRRLALPTALLLTGPLCPAETQHSSPVAAEAPPTFTPAKRITMRPGHAIALTPDTTDQFLQRIVNSTVAENPAIRAELGRLAQDASVVDAFTKRLLALPVTDVSRHLAILSALGEMRNARAIQPLQQFIWSEQAVAPTLEGAMPASGSSYFNHEGALRARATEMLAWINTTDASAEVLRIAAEHPRVEVRLAAIDSYLYNHSDSAEAKAALARIVRPGEIKMIGLPRWTAGVDPKVFDAQVADFYVRHPEELPISPVQSSKPNKISAVAPRVDRTITK